MATNIQGNSASGANDEGNPVKAGGVYNSTKPTLTNNQRGDLQMGTRGGLYTHLAAQDSVTVADVLATDTDASSIGGGALSTRAQMRANNGSSWDRWRNNTDLTLLASAARTATLQSSDQTNYNGRGLHVVLDVTSAGTGSITLTIQAKDALSAKYYTVLAGVAVTTNSTNVYKVYPGLTAAANATANDILTRTWRIDVTHNNANSITYSVGASVIL